MTVPACGKSIATAAFVILGACRSSPNGSAAEPAAVKLAPVVAVAPAGLGASVSAVRAQCLERGGAFAAVGDEGTCRGAKSDWAPKVDWHVWFEDGTLAAQTSFGPVESFDQANARADRLAALPWGKLEQESRTYVCGAMDPAKRLRDGRERRCRYSRYFREGDRVVHILVAVRGILWQTMLDEQHPARPGPATMQPPYPTELGPFKVGDERRLYGRGGALHSFAARKGGLLRTHRRSLPEAARRDRMAHRVQGRPLRRGVHRRCWYAARGDRRLHFKP